MRFEVWGKSRIRRRSPWAARIRKNRTILAGIDPRLKQVAFNRLAILRAYHIRLSRPGKLKTKTEVMRSFLDDLNSGILVPDGATNQIRNLTRSTLYNWDRVYRNDKLAALVPRYRVKQSTGKSTFRPLAKPIEMKFPGRPRRSGKIEFIARVKRRWENPPLECPIHLSIFYSMSIPKKTKMPRRMKMLRGQISHRCKPNLDCLNAFVVDCLTGIVFRENSQIVRFQSKKEFSWWPEVRILLKALSG